MWVVRLLTPQFWRGLLRTDISFESLTSSASRISELALAAAQVFRTMLRQHPSNVKLLRAHGRFVSEVANDPWRATQEFEKADRIEDRQAEVRAAWVGRGRGRGGEGGGGAEVKGRKGVRWGGVPGTWGGKGFLRCRGTQRMGL